MTEDWKGKIVWVCKSCYPDDYEVLTLGGIPQPCFLCEREVETRAVRLWGAIFVLRDLLSKAVGGYINLLRRLDADEKQLTILNEAYDRMAEWREKLWERVDTLLEDRNVLADSLDETWKWFYEGHEAWAAELQDQAEKAMKRVGRELSCVKSSQP